MFSELIFMQNEWKMSDYANLTDMVWSCRVMSLASCVISVKIDLPSNLTTV